MDTIIFIYHLQKSYITHIYMEYTNHKTKYIALKYIDIQKGGNKFEHNCFVNKTLFYTHFDIKNRKTNK